MPINPPTITHQMHKVAVRNGKPMFYEQPELKAARALLTDSLQRYRTDKDNMVTDARHPVELLVKWCFAADGIRHKNGEYRVSRPDTDNLQKLLKDCMTAVGLWKDDALVCSEHVEKRWSVNPGIFITIEDIESWQLREAGLTDEQIEEFEGLKDAEVMWLPYPTNGTGLPS